MAKLYSICREADITKERIQKILGAGANVVLVSGGIDDLCLKYFVEAGAMGVRRCKKADLKRIARATGGLFVQHQISTVLLTFTSVSSLVLIINMCTFGKKFTDARFKCYVTGLATDHSKKDIDW